MKSFFFALLLLFCPFGTIVHTYALETSAQMLPLDNDHTQHKEVEEDTKFSQVFTKMLFMLGITLLIFVIGAYFAKRFLLTQGGLRSTKPGVIQVVEKRSLSQKSTLYLVDIEGERILVAEFPTGGQIIRHMHFDEKKV